MVHCVVMWHLYGLELEWGSQEMQNLDLQKTTSFRLLRSVYIEMYSCIKMCIIIKASLWLNCHKISLTDHPQFSYYSNWDNSVIACPLWTHNFFSGQTAGLRLVSRKECCEGKKFTHTMWWYWWESMVCFDSRGWRLLWRVCRTGVFEQHETVAESDSTCRVADHGASQRTCVCIVLICIHSVLILAAFCVFVTGSDLLVDIIDMRCEQIRYTNDKTQQK